MSDAGPEGGRTLGTRLVPLHEVLGIEPTEMGGGRGRLEMDVGPGHLRTFGIVHGGIYATLLDAVMGMSAASVAPEGHDVVTVQLGVNFIRPVGQGERLVATGTVEHAGRRTAVARGEVRTAAGDLAALGTGTFMFLPPTGPERGGLGPIRNPAAG